ncbi:DUF3023 domain-containing protein [Ehrlichia ruminantium]|uniref:DUF3023 domain-containing protein n=1 Tax=Ehrlichia ruminantium TaxID=779 RepID=A0AAE6QA59_EHRRU|nr:DUF3023 domain-containing protein [Ehrlichia ruminantium]QGR03390.1 DUF3023 domain-containing protein [Ehrlichia ruminantium]QGR04317.1 DUF3023 domain-containing protein [Ehrlichia ruminantium]
MLYNLGIRQEIKINEELCSCLMEQERISYSNISCIGVVDEGGLVVWISNGRDIKQDLCSPSGDSLFKIQIKVSRKKVKHSENLIKLLNILDFAPDSMHFSIYVMVRHAMLNAFLGRTSVSGGKICMPSLLECGEIVLAIPVRIGKHYMNISYNESFLLKEVSHLECVEFKYVSTEQDVSNTAGSTRLLSSTVWYTSYKKLPRIKSKKEELNTALVLENEVNTEELFASYMESSSAVQEEVHCNEEKWEGQEGIEGATSLLGAVKLSDISDWGKRK